MASETFSIEIRSPQDQAAFERLRSILTTTLGLDWQAPLGFPDGCEVADDCAEALWAAGFRIAPSRAEALRDAADAWQQGEWSNHLLPKRNVIGSAQAVTDWLRARADHLDSPDSPHPTAHGTTEPQEDER